MRQEELEEAQPQGGGWWHLVMSVSIVFSLLSYLVLPRYASPPWPTAMSMLFAVIALSALLTSHLIRYGRAVR